MRTQMCVLEFYVFHEVSEDVFFIFFSYGFHQL